MSTFSPHIFYLAGNDWPNIADDEDVRGLFLRVEGGEESCLSCDFTSRELTAGR